MGLIKQKICPPTRSLELPGPDTETRADAFIAVASFTVKFQTCGGFDDVPLGTSLAVVLQHTVQINGNTGALGALGAPLAGLTQGEK